MPELPEVETVVRDLRPLLVGRRLRSVEAGDKPLRRPWQPEWAEQLVGRRVAAVSRRGKWIILDLGEEQALVFHLGMSGQLTVVPAAPPREDHTHLVFALDRGGQLRFRDPRRFGSAILFPTRRAFRDFFAEVGLGPEPWDLRPDVWRLRLGRTRRCLKAVLLDQTVVAGVGNIYADESLFLAGLHPARPANRLTLAEGESLRLAIVAVVEKAIARRGSTIRDYVGGSGLQGEFQNEFQVYGRMGQPCPRCATPITVLRLAGRSSHFCPRCQLAPASGRGCRQRQTPARGRG